jgi:hypothetical protein
MGTVEAYYVAACYLLGIVKGTEFIIHPSKGFTPLALTVTHVKECRCRVVLKGTAPDGPDSHSPSTSILPRHFESNHFQMEDKMAASGAETLICIFYYRRG